MKTKKLTTIKRRTDPRTPEKGLEIKKEATHA